MNEWIDEFVRLVERLRELDPAFAVSGAWSHRWEFKPKLTEKRVTNFEARHDVRLPEPYRSYLQNVANGGAGPHFGFEKLKTPSVIESLRRDFPGVEEIRERVRAAGIDVDERGYYEQPCGDAECPIPDDEWDSFTDGTIPIAEEGSGHWFLLVVRGVSAGEIVSTDANGGVFGPLSFEDWSLGDLHRELDQVEAIRARMEQREDIDTLVTVMTSGIVAGLCGVDFGLNGSGHGNRERARELYRAWLASR